MIDNRTRPARMVAVLREPVFSPGMVEHDAAILRAAADELETRHGIPCPVVSVTALRDLSREEPALVLSMAEAEEALDQLAELERKGTIVLNSPDSVRATRRAALLRLAHPKGPLVEGALVATDDGDQVPAHFLEQGRAWVKRADYHALGPGDVVQIESKDLVPALRAMHARGISKAVVQPHVPGEVVKFYGVAGRSPFFRWFATDGGRGPDEGTAARLRTLALDAAQAAGLSVFGGDAVLRAKGEDPVLVDVNAWPSFWRCRADAARAIADHAAALLGRKARLRRARVKAR